LDTDNDKKFYNSDNNGDYLEKYVINEPTSQVEKTSLKIKKKKRPKRYLYSFWKALRAKSVSHL
jgi:hypothetical protein